MTTLAANQTTRRAQQQRRVEALLKQLDERRRRMYRLRAGGAQYAGLRDLKREFHAVQHDLSAVLEDRAVIAA